MGSPLFWLSCFVVGLLAVTAKNKFKDIPETLKALSTALIIVVGATAIGFAILCAIFVLIALVRALLKI